MQNKLVQKLLFTLFIHLSLHPIYLQPGYKWQVHLITSSSYKLSSVFFKQVGTSRVSEKNKSSMEKYFILCVSVFSFIIYIIISFHFLWEKWIFRKFYIHGILRAWHHFLVKKVAPCRRNTMMMEQWFIITK